MEKSVKEVMKNQIKRNEAAVSQSILDAIKSLEETVADLRRIAESSTPAAKKVALVQNDLRNGVNQAMYAVERAADRVAESHEMALEMLDDEA